MNVKTRNTSRPKGQPNAARTGGASPSSVQRVVLLRLLQRWRKDIEIIRAEAKRYDRDGHVNYAQVINAEADGIMVCANNLEKALAQ